MYNEGVANGTKYFPSLQAIRLMYNEVVDWQRLPIPLNHLLRRKF